MHPKYRHWVSLNMIQRKVPFEEDCKHLYFSSEVKCFEWIDKLNSNDMSCLYKDIVKKNMLLWLLSCIDDVT